MLIFIIDDEKFALKDMEAVIAEAAPDARIEAFMRGEAALGAVGNGKKPDVVFSDIEMPGISGLEFAISMKKISPDARIIFTTAYEKYAIEAFRIKANGYLLKPLTVEGVREELAYIPQIHPADTDRLVIRCFGYFDVYWKGCPLIFGRKQSKELLAYLIDREGAACSSGEIALALWEAGSDERAERNRIRVLINDLRHTLRQIGMEDLLIRQKREIAVRRDLLDCDYYRVLDGDLDGLNSYRGEYMKQYVWAELTNGRLHFIKRKNMH